MSHHDQQDFPEPERVIVPPGDAHAFVSTATDWLSTRVREALQLRGACVIGLSGGSTPGPIYERLGAREGIDWEKVYVFLVDERFVPADDPDSNANLVSRTLLKNARIPAENLIFPDTSLPIDECVVSYGKRLDETFAKIHAPDVVTLGLGPDGHIASLFPPAYEAWLGKNETCLHTTTERFAAFDRITLSLTTLLLSSNHVFFFKGADKLGVFEEMMEALRHGSDVARWPGQDVIRAGHSTVIFQE